MLVKIWISLVLAFTAYSLMVYTRADTGHSSPVPDAHIKNGWQLWQSKNCQSCHQLYGLGGYMGPDLTNVFSEKGGRYAATFIKYGTGKMPNFHFSDSETQDLICFLAWIDKSGKTNIPANLVHWWGVENK